MLDFHSIMTAHGFPNGGHDIESTITGFDYDIQFSLLDQSTIFDADRSRTHRQWDNPDAFIRCELVMRSSDIQLATLYFLQRWSTELRYRFPVREIIDIRTDNESATIHILTITKYNAMTLLFTIR